MEQLLKKLRLPPPVREKVLEYQRLAELKSTSAVPSSCMAAVCIELACNQLDEPVDKKLLQRFSGQQGRSYLSTLQTMKQLLQLDSQQPSLRDLAVRFGCVEAEGKAGQLLKCYEHQLCQRYTAAQRDSIQLSKPLYSAAALYTACRLMKIRCDKAKFQGVAAASRAMFSTVLEDMQGCVSAVSENDRQMKPVADSTMETEEEEEGEEEENRRVENGWFITIPHLCLMPQHLPTSDGVGGFLHQEDLQSRYCCNPLSEEYLAWKEKIISTARSRLQQEASSGERQLPSM